MRRLLYATVFLALTNLGSARATHPPEFCATDALLELFPEIEPYERGWLDVGAGHRVYYEQSGNPKGKPVLFVHGGPGANTGPKQRRFFDPKVYRIVLVDQRGCGQSTPLGCLVENRTHHLVDDFEKIRVHLKIEKWMIFGGSWGSTLGLLYAQAHPGRVTELILRGIFLGHRADIDSIYTERTVAYFPEAWAKFIAAIPVEYRDNPYRGLEVLLAGTPDEQARAVRATTAWEDTLATRAVIAPESVDVGAADIAAARVAAHYQANGLFLTTDHQVIENVDRLRGLPVTIINGRFDLITPPSNALRLHLAWPGSRLWIVPGGGHTMWDPAITDALLRAARDYGRTP